MLKVRTHNTEHGEKAEILCKSIECLGITELTCCEVETIEGEADITGYYHGKSYTNVIIPLHNLTEAIPV